MDTLKRDCGGVLLKKCTRNNKTWIVVKAVSYDLAKELNVYLKNRGIKNISRNKDNAFIVETDSFIPIDPLITVYMRKKNE